MNETVQIKAESEQWETWGEMGGEADERSVTEKT